MAFDTDIGHVTVFHTNEESSWESIHNMGKMLTQQEVKIES